MELGAAAGTGGDWAERTYEAMAPVYDDFTAHHEYEAWLTDLLKVLGKHDLQGNRLLDVACGTGKSFLPMLPRGWQVTGCDISPAMLELARAKAGDDVRLTVANMLELPRFGEFDLIWVLDDAINYLLSPAELRQALAGMLANLAPTGLLLFDVNELQAYRTFFAETVEVERDGGRLVWRGLAEKDVAPGSICESRMEVVSDGADANSSSADPHPPPAPLPRSGGAGGDRGGRPGMPRRLRPRPRWHPQPAARRLDPHQGDLHRPQCQRLAPVPSADSCLRRRP